MAIFSERQHVIKGGVIRITKKLSSILPQVKVLELLISIDYNIPIQTRICFLISKHVQGLKPHTHPPYNVQICWPNESHLLVFSHLHTNN